MPGDLPLLYHTHHSFFQEDIPYWKSLAAQQGGIVLELGCGGGRVLIPLAIAGNPVIGLDRDPEMLSILQVDYPQELQSSVSVFQADMNHFCLEAPFSLIIMACNTLSSLPDEERPHVLRRVAGHLAEGGMFAASVPNPAALLALEPVGAPEVEGEFEHPATGHPVQASSAWTRQGSRLEMSWIYDQLLPDGNVKRETATVSHSLVSREQLSGELTEAGLQIVALHGDYDQSPYHPDAPYLIIHCLAQ